MPGPSRWPLLSHVAPFSPRGCQEVPVLPPASTTSPLRPVTEAAPQRGNSRLEFASPTSNKPRRLRSVPAGQGGPGLILQEGGPARTPLSPGAPTPGPGEAPCGSCNLHNPCVIPWPQLSHQWIKEPSGVVLLALSQADAISWPQTVPSTRGDGTAGTGLSQHQWQVWIWLGLVPASMVVAFGALPAGRLLEKLSLRPGWFFGIGLVARGPWGHPLCPATEQLPAQQAQPSPTTKHFQSAAKKQGTGQGEGRNNSCLPGQPLPSRAWGHTYRIWDKKPPAGAVC